MQINPISNTNFLGYKNVINNVCKDANRPEYFAYMSMQLDNYGKKDLANWHAIQKNFLQREELKDTITFALLKLENKPLLILCDTLLEISEQDKGTELEKFMLKAYTLIARLTNQIRLGMPVCYDRGFSETLINARKDLLPIFDNDNAMVNEIMLSGIVPKVEYKTAANLINKEIQEEMNRYFEV